MTTERSSVSVSLTHTLFVHLSFSISSSLFLVRSRLSYVVCLVGGYIVGYGICLSRPKKCGLGFVRLNLQLFKIYRQQHTREERNMQIDTSVTSIPISLLRSLGNEKRKPAKGKEGKQILIIYFLIPEDGFLPCCT